MQQVYAFLDIFVIELDDSKVPNQLSEKCMHKYMHKKKKKEKNSIYIVVLGGSNQSYVIISTKKKNNIYIDFIFLAPFWFKSPKH